MTAPAPRAARRRLVRDGIGVGLATGAYGISFGALGVTAGLSVVQTCALSLLVFTGASQFALVGVLGAGGAPVAGALSALLLGSPRAARPRRRAGDHSRPAPVLIAGVVALIVGRRAPPGQPKQHARHVNVAGHRFTWRARLVKGRSATFTWRAYAGG